MKQSILLPGKTIIICCSVFFTCFLSRAQNMNASLAAYADKYRQERTYIHYDKSAYSAGETIWFKAYMMTEIAPADESKTLYIDWTDDKGEILQHSVSPLLDAVTNGQFEIPADYKGKYIQVRAYTRWMLNFDSAFLYNKTIRILSKENTSSPSKIMAIPSISFFPEGGDAIEGITNKIAFKANDQWGRPVRVKGVVIDNQGKVQDSLRTIHDGMGYFFLLPEAGAVYTVKWKDEKNAEHTASLPAIRQNGVALQVTISGTTRFFNVRYTKEVADAMDTLHIMGTMYQHLAFSVARATNTSFIKGTIPTGGLPSGILTITVFDKQWKPLTERITYVNNEEYLFRPEMEVQHWGLNKRARNEIKITVPDSLVANLSVSVTDAGIGEDSSNNIVSHLLLSSELKGDIYNPAYYFSNLSDSVSQHLDLVMLTHGWRRFKWEEIVSGKFHKPKFERDTSYLSLSGKVYGVLPGQISPGTAMVMILKQKDKQGGVLLMPLNSDGTFNDPATLIFDTAHVYYQFPKAKGLNDASVQFMTDRLPPAKIPAADNNNQWPDTTGFYRQWALVNEANEMAERMKIKTLENVTVRSKTKSAIQQMDEKYTSGLFSGDGDGYQFDLINDPFAKSAPNIFNYLQGKVAGLQVNTSSNPPSLQWRGGAPQLYLDEVPTDPDFISSVNVNDVAYIKVFRPPFMGGFNGANGAIAIYTRRGNDVKPEPGKGLKNNKIFGYTLIKEFYSPNYSSFSTKNDDRDIRTTLYWNPSVITTPQKHEAVLTFYNNDVSNAFHVVIEGMTRDGRLAHIEQVME
ncbi:MAG: hypothetical protein Q8941_08285 [Bacteroidota bacterium]|nr:hypothetical protein [Bacteroidota bacterium]